MVILVSGPTASTHLRHAGDPRLGRLVTPRGGHRLAALPPGQVLGADNDCYARFDARRYRRMLAALAAARPPGLRFVSAPDVVGCAGPTLALWRLWRPDLAALGLPAALVAQDGAEGLELPWGELAALFVGGTTRWKESAAALALAEEAHRRGKWVHVGRVNTLRRVRPVHDWGCVDSFDGSIFSRQPEKFLPRTLRYLRELEAQPRLWGD